MTVPVLSLQIEKSHLSIYVKMHEPGGRKQGEEFEF